MSAEDVQVTRDFYAAFAHGDVAAAMAGLDENIEWTSPESLPTGGTRRGHAALGAHVGEVVKQYQELHIEPVEFIDDGGTIVVLTRSRRRQLRPDGRPSLAYAGRKGSVVHRVPGHRRGAPGARTGDRFVLVGGGTSA